jgi:diguanylate cyclase (GGDEF)-like protein
MPPTTPGVDEHALLALVESGPASLILMDGSGTIVWANRTAADTLDTTVADLVGTVAFDLLHPDDVPMAANALGLLAAGRLVGDDAYRLVPVSYRLRTGADRYHWFEVAVKPMYAPGEAPMMALVFIDASRLTELSQIVSHVAAHEPIERILADLVRIHSVDSPARSVTIIWTDDEGARRVERAAAAPPVAPDDTAAVPWTLARTANGPVSMETAELPAAVRDTVTASGFAGCSAFRVADPGAPEPAVVVVWWPSADVAEIQIRRLRRELVPALELALDRREHLRRLNDAAMRDPLTGLHNRRALLAHLAQLADAKRPTGLLYCDLDGFKPVNDTWGHTVGDRVLAAVAQRIASVTRDADLTARVGGDEFAVVLTDANEEVAVALSDRIVAAMRAPFDTGEGGTVTIGVSVGICVTPGDTAFDVDRLVACADAAMYEAKRSPGERRVVAVPLSDS